MIKKIVKILSKRISVGIVAALLFVVAALVYSLGYSMAMNKFNSIVGYTQEKQRMYSKLSEVDYNIRDEYIGNIDEDKLFNGTCSGYMKGLTDSNCKFLSAADYKSYMNEQENLPGDVGSKFLSANTAVISCPCLGKKFSENFVSTLNNLISQGVKDVIIDLRNSSKGVEYELFQACEYISPKGDLIKTLDSEGKEEVVCRSSSDAAQINSIAVLVNDKTSGLAEVFASVLKDSCGAKLVGVDTAGSAVKNKVVNLSDDSVIVFPSAFYLTSSGKKFFKNGIVPDIKIANKSADEDLQLNQAIGAL